MKIVTKRLFKLWGRIWWIDKNDQRNFFAIPEREAIYKWVASKKELTFRFKTAIWSHLRKMAPRIYPNRLNQILLYDAEIEEITNKKVVAQRQLKLFK